MRVSRSKVTVALALACVGLTANAEAASASAPAARQTVAMVFASTLGDDVRSNSSLGLPEIEVLRWIAESGSSAGVRYTGIVDANSDGRDDDRKVTVRYFGNSAVAHLDRKANDPNAATDLGFTFRDRRAVLAESARNVDSVLLFLQRRYGDDSWSMSTLAQVKTEVAPGVRVVSDYDGNKDGYDDDGRVTLLARGKAVTLTLGAREGQRGKVTYGATWQHPIAARAHTPPRVFERTSAADGAKVVAENITLYASQDKHAPRDVRVLRDATSWLPRSDRSGIVDANRDGLDDDGKLTIQFNHGRDVFLLTVPTSGKVKVTVLKR